ncbi:MAG: DNA-binding protein [Alphaproteobacteria bacterium]|nr:DNA-binding protein [Alphaproteobacteria bacterium]MDE2111037.1 DNA-binding protein [Alphaproteobacteria bacterium]MDE2493802.1 DNA-binding protein [Alphaproteobacteria bacterium]
MALFFDAEWFDARLAAVGLSRAALAAALGLTTDDLALLWKDQRELSEQDVRVIAGLIGAGAEVVAAHAGVSTPVPKPPSDIEARLAGLESELEAVKAQLATMMKQR